MKHSTVAERGRPDAWAVLLAGGDGTRLQSLTLKVAGEHAAHALAADGLELGLTSPQLMSDAARAVSRELPDDLLDGPLQIGFVTSRRLVVPTAARQSQQVAQQADGIIGLQFHDDLPFPLVREFKSCETFFEASSSSVSRPTRRSNSATRSPSCGDADSFSKTRLACSRICFFQRESRFSPICRFEFTIFRH